MVLTWAAYLLYILIRFHILKILTFNRIFKFKFKFLRWNTYLSLYYKMTNMSMFLKLCSWLPSQSCKPGYKSATLSNSIKIFATLGQNVTIMWPFCGQLTRPWKTNADQTFSFYLILCKYKQCQTFILVLFQTTGLKELTLCKDSGVKHLALWKQSRLKNLTHLHI